MQEENILLPHKLTLQDRKKLTLTAVREIISFDENAVLLETALGTLEIQGQELKLKNLSTEGAVSVEGKIDALYYGQLQKKGSFWGRLFP
ncbi:MAG: sporulation protein YabP [Oscillospiraceae bacterium]|nr:sporulation protein YabP [Oscillospiraceae bacterium]